MLFFLVSAILKIQRVLAKALVPLLGAARGFFLGADSQSPQQGCSLKCRARAGRCRWPRRSRCMSRLWSLPSWCSLRTTPTTTPPSTTAVATGKGKPGEAVTKSKIKQFHQRVMLSTSEGYSDPAPFVYCKGGVTHSSRPPLPKRSDVLSHVALGGKLTMRSQKQPRRRPSHDTTHDTAATQTYRNGAPAVPEEVSIVLVHGRCRPLYLKRPSSEGGVLVLDEM